MASSIPTYIGPNAIAEMLTFCREHRQQKLLLVADSNTHRVLGQAVEKTLKDDGFDLQRVILAGDEVVADATYILDVLLPYDGDTRTFIAVGAGTITDITRFVSHRTKNPFISMPTAPSVDGFTSIGAPLIVHGVKTTYIAQPPNAIFADLDILTAAPRNMIAAGFADMLGKYTSVADWRLGHLLWDEPYDESIAHRTLTAVQNCSEQVEAIAAASPQGIRSLMEALIESGFCMLDLGSSRSASGAEHHFSHYWEMQLLRQGRPAILHGAKVGVATVQVAGLYERIRQLSKPQISDLLEASGLPSREEEIQRIRAGYGEEMTDEIVTAQESFLEMTEETFNGLQHKILERWQDIQEIAQEVPSPQRIAELLQKVGGPTTVQDLGLTHDELVLASNNGHYLRERFTSRKLTYYLGLGSFVTG